MALNPVEPSALMALELEGIPEVSQPILFLLFQGGNGIHHPTKPL